MLLRKLLTNNRYQNVMEELISELNKQSVPLTSHFVKINDGHSKLCNLFTLSQLIHLFIISFNYHGTKNGIFLS